MLMRSTYEQALELYLDIEGLISTGFTNEATDTHIRNQVPTGIYEHFKSTPEESMFYAVLGVGRDVDNGVYRVAYRALYPPHFGQIAFRQLVGKNPKTGANDGFLMPVDRAEYRGPRFQKVLECSLEDLARYEPSYYRR